MMHTGIEQLECMDTRAEQNYLHQNQLPAEVQVIASIEHEIVVKSQYTYRDISKVIDMDNVRD
jgi:hypothetical protein